MTEAIVPVPVACCRASPTARPVRAVKVAELARSIAEIGLRQPISVRPLGGGDYEVRGGNHCLAAIVELGHAVIPAIVREDDDLRAELAELDENLVRNDLSPAERAVAVARRKAIYEALHPETAHGATGKKRPKTQSRQVGDSNGVDDFAKLPTSSNVDGRRKETRRQVGDESVALRFTQATAEATGASERTIQREAERGEKIGEEVLRKVAGTSLDKGEELDALAPAPGGEAGRDRRPRRRRREGLGQERGEEARPRDARGRTCRAATGAAGQALRRRSRRSGMALRAVVAGDRHGPRRRQPLSDLGDRGDHRTAGRRHRRARLRSGPVEPGFGKVSTPEGHAAEESPGTPSQSATESGTTRINGAEAASEEGVDVEEHVVAKHPPEASGDGIGASLPDWACEPIPEFLRRDR